MSDIKKLVGKKINRIFLNEQYLKFATDQGNIIYTVDGDCCSQSVFYDFFGVRKLLENGKVLRQSVFYDFFGVRKLLENGKVISAREIDINPEDVIEDLVRQRDKKSYQESISVYGFEIVTEHPLFGEQTSVFSFRNYSNGYYGGWLCEFANDIDVEPEIFDDVIETVQQGEK